MTITVRLKKYPKLSTYEAETIEETPVIIIYNNIFNSNFDLKLIKNKESINDNAVGI